MGMLSKLFFIIYMFLISDFRYTNTLNQTTSYVSVFVLLGYQLERNK